MNTFGVDGWEPDERATLEICEQWCTALLWIVPAQVGGQWRLDDVMRLRLDQHFQKVSGELTGAAGGSTLQGGTVTGAAIAFTIGDASYIGTVDGATITGTRTAGGQQTAWRATRASSAP